MKKLFGALVKLFSLLAVLGALLYAAVLYWDKIMAVVAKLLSLIHISGPPTQPARPPTTRRPCWRPPSPRGSSPWSTPPR